MEALLNVSPVYASNDAGRLINVYNKVESNVRSLQSLGVESDSYGTMLVPLMLSKCQKN